MARKRCPICKAKTSPRTRGERLQSFPNALRALGLPGPVAHTSCLLAQLKASTRALEARGTKLPIANRNASQLVNTLESNS